MQTLRIRKIFSLYIPAATPTELRATPFPNGSSAFGFTLSNANNSESYQYHVRLLSNDANGRGITESTVNCFEWGKRAPLQFHHNKETKFIQGVVIKIKLQHKVFDFRKIESQCARIKVVCSDTNGNFLQEGFSDVFQVLPKRRGKDDGEADDEETIIVSWPETSQPQDYLPERYYDNSNVFHSRQRSDSNNNSNDYSSSYPHETDDYSPEDESGSNQMQIYSDSGSIESPVDYQLTTNSNRSESYMVLYNGNAEVVGNFRALNFYKASDINLKEDISLLSEDRDCREAILKLDGVEYKFKPGVKAATNRRFVGYIAQQIESIVPEAVQLIDGILHVDYEALIPYLSESIRANFNDIQNIASKTERLQKTVDMLYEQFIKRETSAKPTNEAKSTKSSGSTRTSKLKKVLFGSLAVLVVLALATVGVLVFVNSRNPNDGTPPGPEDPPNPQDDEDTKIRNILAEFYNSTNGPYWRRSFNWMKKNRHHCSWYGVTCMPSKIRIDLSYNGLAGTIPNSFGNLEPYLELVLNDNFINGTLPSFNGSSLTILNLANNLVAGAIPPLLGYQKALTQLTLSHNKLNGTIPSTFINLHALETLDLSYNALNGSIPSLEGSPQLILLNVSHNQLTGAIPDAKQIFWLRAMDLSYNKLEGTLPMHSIYLEYLNIEHNNFHGDLRMLKDFGSSLNHLQIASNKFSGVLELTQDHWKNLGYLNVSSNQLTGFSHSESDAWPTICDATKNDFVCPISNQTAVRCKAVCN